MLEQVLAHLRNWFVVPGGIITGAFVAENGELSRLCGVELPIKEGQYYRILGSVFNDGLYQHPDATLKDETFDGCVWMLAVPQAVVDLAAEIEAWQTKNGDAAASPYASESFGGYSYTKATDAATSGAVTWQAAFADRLSRWRKI